MVLRQLHALLVAFAMAFAVAGGGARGGLEPSQDAHLFVGVDQPALCPPPRHDGDARSVRQQGHRTADHQLAFAGLLPDPRPSLAPGQWIRVREHLCAHLRTDQLFSSARTSRGPPVVDVS